jgi:hypothetical protein
VSYAYYARLEQGPLRGAHIERHEPYVLAEGGGIQRADAKSLYACARGWPDWSWMTNTLTGRHAPQPVLGYPARFQSFNERRFPDA